MKVNFRESEVLTPVDDNLGQQVRRSKETPSESRCPEGTGKDDLVEDSAPQNQGTVSQDEDLCFMVVQTACTVKLKIHERIPGTLEEDFQVPAGGGGSI